MKNSLRGLQKLTGFLERQPWAARKELRGIADAEAVQEVERSRVPPKKAESTFALSKPDIGPPSSPIARAATIGKPLKRHLAMGSTNTYRRLMRPCSINATSVPVTTAGPPGGPSRQRSRAAPLWPTAGPAAVKTKSSGNLPSKPSSTGYRDCFVSGHDRSRIVEALHRWRTARPVLRGGDLAVSLVEDPIHVRAHERAEVNDLCRLRRSVPAF